MSRTIGKTQQAFEEAINAAKKELYKREARCHKYYYILFPYIYYKLAGGKDFWENWLNVHPDCKVRFIKDITGDNQLYRLTKKGELKKIYV